MEIGTVFCPPKMGCYYPFVFAVYVLQDYSKILVFFFFHYSEILVSFNFRLF